MNSRYLDALSNLAMVSVYFTLASVIVIVLFGILRQSLQMRVLFGRLTGMSVALLFCLLIDATYWGFANAWRVYSVNILGIPQDQLNPNPWNNYAIITVKAILIIGVGFVRYLLRNAFNDAYAAAYAAVVEETNDAIGVLNPNGTVYYWNRAMYRLFDFPPEADVRGKDVRDLIMLGPDMESERVRFDSVVAELRDNPDKKVDDTFLRRKDARGKIKMIRVSMSRRNGVNNAFEGCFGIMKDALFDPLFPWLGRRMSEPIATARNNLLRGQSKICTGLFADIMAFSKLIEEVEHETVQKFVAEYFDAMVDTVDENGGVVVDLVGDEVFGLFGVLDESDAQQQASAASALRAAMQMQRRFQPLAESFLQRARAITANADIDLPRLGVGINTGRMLIGPIGGGHLTHFTAIGQAVVRAKRVEELTHDPVQNYPSILLTDSTKTNIENSGARVTLAEVDTVQLRLSGVDREARRLRLFSPTMAGPPPRPPAPRVPVQAGVQPPPGKTPGPALPKSHKIYVSYAWGEDKTAAGRQRDEVVNRLCAAVRASGREIARDKETMRSGDSIEHFTNEIARAERIIAVISEKSLHSSYCMVRELFRAYRRCDYDREEFRQKVITLLMDDARPLLQDESAFAALAAEWKTKLDSLQASLCLTDPQKRGHDIWKFVDRLEAMVPRLPEMLAILKDRVMPRGFEEIVAKNFEEVIALLPPAPPK